MARRAPALPTRDSAAFWQEVAQRLDRAAPTPLYHQLAMALRWEIGMGRLRLDQPMLPIRAAAALLDVNYHTVRRAYSELARLGVVASARRRGTVVRDDATQNVVSAPSAPAIAVECNLSQAAQLAREIHEAISIPSLAWHLDWPEPPPGPIVTTSFHANEARRRWPRRSISAVPLVPHADLMGLVAATARALQLQELVIVERERATGCALAAELEPLLRATGLEWRTAVAGTGQRLLAGSPHALHLVAPRLFDALPWRMQSHPQVLELRFQVAVDAWAPLRSALTQVTGA